MKLTKSKLKQIIREELKTLLEVGGGKGGGSTIPSEKNPQKEKADRCSELRRKKSKEEKLSEEDQEFLNNKCGGTGPTGRKS